MSAWPKNIRSFWFIFGQWPMTDGNLKPWRCCNHIMSITLCIRIMGGIVITLCPSHFVSMLSVPHFDLFQKSLTNWSQTWLHRSMDGSLKPFSLFIDWSSTKLLVFVLIRTAKMAAPAETRCPKVLIKRIMFLCLDRLCFNQFWRFFPL